MKRKLLLSSTIIPALLASGALGQVVNFHDAATRQLDFSGTHYYELFAGQGAYADPGNDVWNGFCFSGGPGSTYFYSGPPGSSGLIPQQFGNPGNPYAACSYSAYYASYSAGSGWVSSTGASLFNFATAGLTTSGNSTSDGQWTPIQLSVKPYSEDNGEGQTTVFVPNGSPSFLLGEAALSAGSEVFTLHKVPTGTYGLYLYGVDYKNNRGTLFSVNSGSAHNGIDATLNNGIGTPANAFVEGQNFVIFQNVTPDSNGNITITGVPNPQDSVGNANLAGAIDVNGFQLIFNPPPTAVANTAAQNVFAGGTASFSFSPAFAASPSFRWQSIIGGVTNDLTDGVSISGSTTTNLIINNVAATNVGLYQCVISTTTATNTSPAAPLTILNSPATGPLQEGDSTSTVGNILQPGDALTDVNNSSGGPPYNSIPLPFDMTVTNVEDNTLYQYVNFSPNGSVPPFSGPVGFMVTPNIGPTIVTGIRFFTASSHPEDDPADYLLEGSNDGGNTFAPIAGGLIGLPAQRNAAGGVINFTNQVLKEMVFTNSAAYSTYQLVFTNVNDNDTASNGMQIAELQLLGSFPAEPPGIAQEPGAADILLVGATLHATVAASGPGPWSYKWYFNNSQQITNATNAILTLANLQTNSSGSYNCVISTPNGSTNSTALSLTVVPPTPYQQSILALQPLAYWPLNETNGSTAFDYVNGNNGTYDGAINLAQPGVPYQGFGSPSYSVAFDGGSTYVDIPEGPFNLTGPITIMGWIQSSSIGTLEGILGHGDDSYSLAVTPNGEVQFMDGNASIDSTNISVIDGNWHLVAGVYTGGSGVNDFLYVDGVLVATGVTTSVAGSGYDLWIGGAPDYGVERIFDGNLCHAAVIPQGLSAAQIEQTYLAGGPAPTVSVPSTPITVDQGADEAISPFYVSGTAPLFYQWSYLNGSGTAVLIPTATNGTLLLTDVQPAQSAYQYFVVVSNTYGAVTSSYVTLNVLSGAPTLVSDVSPALTVVPEGVPVTFSVTATGSAPFTYQWHHALSAIDGATNSTYMVTPLPGTNSYSVVVSNSAGSTPGASAVVIGLTGVPPVLAFNGNGSDWTLNDGGNITPIITNNVLTLTDGNVDESSSAFFDTPQYIGGFIASYVYQAIGKYPHGSGITFCIQDSPAGTNAVGADGGDLGFTGITNSAAFELTVSGGASSGTGIQFGTDGSTPDSPNPTAPVSRCGLVNLSSGDPIYVQIYYGQNVATVWLTDTMTGAMFTTNYVADLPAIVGGASAWIGLTGSTGGSASTQTVSNFLFSYTTPPILSLTRRTPGSVAVSWPVSVSTLFGLQASIAVNGPWTNVMVAPEIVYFQNQVTLTPGTSTAFYRLVLP